MDKQEQRAFAIQNRRFIFHKDEKSTYICAKAYSFIRAKRCENIGIYVSFKDEVDTHGLIKKLIKDGIHVFVPYIEGNEMYFSQITSFDELEVGKYGILEPKNKIPYKGDLEVNIVPALLVDRKGHRLGYGKGYYDRYLNTHSDFAVCLVYTEQMVDEVVHDEFDHKMNMLIHE